LREHIGELGEIEEMGEMISNRLSEMEGKNKMSVEDIEHLEVVEEMERALNKRLAALEDKYSKH
jgi:hypothetical protein